jgi:hypothetical protein
MNDRDRRSMDDVLASIRRIVRTEKESAVASGYDEPRGRSDGDGPLLLTPDMRTDVGPAEAGDGADELMADMSEASAEPLPAMAETDALRELVRELLRDELAGGAAAEAVRDIIRDELTSGRIGTNISQNVQRMIRTEVARATQAPR